MWQVLRDGNWTQVDDATVIAWIQSRQIDANTPVRHATWPAPQPLAAVAGFQHYLRAQPVKSKGLGTGAIVAIVLGCIAVVAILVVIATRGHGSSSDDDDSGPPQTCHDVGDAFHICVEGRDTTQVDGKPYMRVSLGITNSSHTPDDISDFFDLKFALRDTAGYEYGASEVLDFNTTSCTVVLDSLQPHDTLHCSALFTQPTGASKLEQYVIVKHAGHHVRLALP